MSDQPQKKPRLRVDSYLNWIKSEGVPIAEDYALDLFAVETAPWARFGMKGAACHLKGRGDFATMFLFELAPGGSSTPTKHLYEELIYVLEGTGSTQLEFPDGGKRSFEWGPHSLFAIPLNAKHRHFNGSGQKRALMVSTVNMPLIMNIFHNEDFIFNTSAPFMDRIGKDEYYGGQGDLVLVRQGSHMWETNFVPDLEHLELQSYEARGAGGANIKLILADSSMHAHISEMPPGTYKKAHRHSAGTHVMFLVGTGYSLAWFDGDKDYRRIDWRHGIVYPPAEQQIHQHFNTCDRAARYLATGIGGIRYPMTAASRRTGGDDADGNKLGATARSVKDGGDQIEYEDQNPRIHPEWLAEMKKNGGTVDPLMYKWFPETRAAE